MTREEATEELERLLRHWDLIDEGIYDLSEHDQDAVEIALSSLRPVSREQVEKVFPGCPYCDMAKANDNIYNKALWVKEAETSKWTLAGKSLQYCPICGRPLTDEAVQMVMERLEALKDGL